MISSNFLNTLLLLIAGMNMNTFMYYHSTCCFSSAFIVQNTIEIPRIGIPIATTIKDERKMKTKRYATQSSSAREGVKGIQKGGAGKTRRQKNTPPPMQRKQQQQRRQTSIEKANQEYKEKRLQKRMDKLLKKIRSRIDEMDTETDTDTSMIQRECDQLLGICAAMNDWAKYDYVVETIMKEQLNLSIQPSSYRVSLRECYTAGNGLSAIRIYDLMLSENLTLEGSDIDLIIGSLCKQNNSNDNRVGKTGTTNDEELWEKALDILHFAAMHYEDMGGNTVKVDSYNNVLSIMEQGNHWKQAISLLTLMEEDNEENSSTTATTSTRRRHPSPNLSTYHAVLNVLITSNQLEQATSLLLSLSQNENHSKPKPSTYTFDIVLSALTKNDRRGTNYKQAVEILNAMPPLNIPTPITMYNRVISSCANARQTNVAKDIFDTMKKQKIHPDTVTYNSLISACANQGWTADALKLFNECKQVKYCQPDVITYTNTIRACGRNRMSKKALELLADAKKESIPLDVFLYTALIDVCGKNRDWRNALELLNDMKRNSIFPNQHTYSALINALGNSGQWERALDVLNQMKEKNMRVSVVAYNSAIAALAKESRKVGVDDAGSGMKRDEMWKKAIELLDEMKADRVWPDKYSYSSAITCCASGARYEEAINLIKTMRSGPAKIRPNRISYTGAMTACARAGEWSHALRLFIDMRADHIKCDIVAYNALISAFTNGGKTDMAFDVWNEICGKKGSNITGKSNENNKSENVEPDIITLTNVIACLERAEGKDNLSRMDMVIEDAVERQIILSDDSMDTKWEIDLSGMSLPVARGACRYIMKRLLKTVTPGPEVEDLMLITGVGKQHHQNQNQDDEITGQGSRTALREHVRQILRQDFEPPLYSTVPSNAAGTVQVNKDVLEKWMKTQKNSL